MFESLEALGLEPVTEWMFYKGDMSFMVKGNEILLRSADDPNRLRGLNLNYFGLDEAREFGDDTVFNVLIGRLRKSDVDNWAISSTSLGKNWFWKICQSEGLEKAFETGYGKNDRLTVIVQSSWENTFLPAPFLLELQRRYSDQLAQQELYGKIVDFSAGIFQRSWFKDKVPYFRPTTGIRSWDLAASVHSWSDYTVGALMTKREGIEYVCDVIRSKTMAIQDLIVETALRDGPGIVIAIESISMQAVITASITADPRMAAYRVIAHRPDTDKYARALPLTSRFEQSLIRLCEGAWNKDYVDEFCSFTPELKGGHDDQCLTSGTLIATPCGDRKIEDIKEGDYVITPIGIKKVEITFKREVLEKYIVEHNGLCGTGNHPIFSHDDFIEMDALKQGSHVSILNIKGAILWLLRSCLRGESTRKLVGKPAIITMSHIIPQQRWDSGKVRAAELCQLFIRMRGSQPIPVKKFLKGLSCIIEIITGIIMILLTLSLRKVLNIFKGICLVYAHPGKQRILTTSDILLFHGTGLLKGVSGILSMLKKTVLVFQKSILVKYAKKIFGVRATPDQDIVVTIVVKKPEELSQEYLLKKYAKNVVINSKQDIIRVIQQNYVQSVSNVLVYNLKVKDASCYYANGILVGNCDATSQGHHLLNRPSTLRTPPYGTYTWPDPKNPEEAKLVQLLAAVELKEYRAYVVGVRYHPYRNELEINYAECFSGISDLAKALKGYQKRYGTEDLSSNEYKAVDIALAKEKAHLMIGKLDEAGSIYEFNRMVDTSKVLIREGCVVTAELSTAQPDDMTPYVKALLRIVQECRAIHREIPKPLAPFEKQRKEFREKIATAKSKKDGWV